VGAAPAHGARPRWVLPTTPRPTTASPVHSPTRTRLVAAAPAEVNGVDAAAEARGGDELTAMDRIENWG
jgi:hypothetical protein